MIIGVNMKRFLLFLLFFATILLRAQDAEVICWWNFDDPKPVKDLAYEDEEEGGEENVTLEAVSGSPFTIAGPP
jgi:hypothetical protein